MALVVRARPELLGERRLAVDLERAESPANGERLPEQPRDKRGRRRRSRSKSTISSDTTRFFPRNMPVCSADLARSRSASMASPARRSTTATVTVIWKSEACVRISPAGSAVQRFTPRHLSSAGHPEETALDCLPRP